MSIELEKKTMNDTVGKPSKFKDAEKILREEEEEKFRAERKKRAEVQI